MKKLFGGSGRASSGKKEASGPLTNKTVQVGSYQVLCGALLGSGGYADIYSVVNISSGGRFALKHLRLAGEPETISEVQREAKTMVRLKGHPNILRLHAVAFAGPRGGETDGFFLLDLCPGTLLDLMARHAYQLEDATVLHIFGCIVAAVAHMHHQKPPLAHRDLKAENVLMLPDGTWVLCDFGSATTRAQVYDSAEAMAAEEEVIRKHTTPAYRPPEMWDLYLRQPIDTKVDIWALGVLLYVLCFGRLPFNGDSKLAVLNAKYDLPQTGRPPQLRGLIRVLLEPDPTQRPAIDAVCRQLDEAARAITGRGLPQLKTAACNSSNGGSSMTPAASQQQQQQRLEQSAPPAVPLPAPAAAASLPAAGSFWTTADAAVTAAPAAQQQQQQQQQQPDWARFSSGGIVGSAAAAAASPAAATAARTIATPQGSASPASVAAADRPSSAARPSAASQQQSHDSNGVSAGSGSGSGSTNGAPGVSSDGFSAAGHQQQLRDKSSDGQLSRLADITARAAQAAQAAAAARMTAAQLQQPGNAAAASAVDTTRSSRAGNAAAGSLVAERVPQPYASLSGSVESIRPRSQTSSSNGAGAGGGGFSSSSSVAAAPKQAQQAGSNDPLGKAGGSAAPAALLAATASASQPPKQQQQQQQQPRPAPVPVPTPVGAANAAAAATAAAAVAPASGVSNTSAAASGGTASVAAGLAELRSAVFGELDLLRAQVVSLADAEQAFLIRIKQLEDYGQQQHEAVGRLQQQVASLQQQLARLQQQPSQPQQHGTLESPAGSASLPLVDDGTADRHGWLRGMTRSSRGSDSGVGGNISTHQQQAGVSGGGGGQFWSQHSDIL